MYQKFDEIQIYVIYWANNLIFAKMLCIYIYIYMSFGNSVEDKLLKLFMNRKISLIPQLHPSKCGTSFVNDARNCNLLVI